MITEVMNGSKMPFFDDALNFLPHGFFIGLFLLALLMMFRIHNVISAVEVSVGAEEQILSCNQPDMDGLGCENQDEEAVAMIEESPSGGFTAQNFNCLSSLTYYFLPCICGLFYLAVIICLNWSFKYYCRDWKFS